ncbi:hypothetical protein CPB86DRAFT_560782 [Serendipita vermifera]|nr:hypothetical protein CPB86DRAFT_560782 [Serendipita vermifera]
MAQENTHAQKMAEMAKHKDGHIAYWKNHNRQTDPKRFEDGFIQGWCDAENPSYPNINRDSMLEQRKQENIRSCGDSPCMWAFGDGYHEGFDSRRCLKIESKPQENTHDQKMAALRQHKEAHVAYWKARNTETDPQRFENGFIQGWCDAENPSYPNINRDSMLSQRREENSRRCGNSPIEWVFDHGYHEGFDSRRSLHNKPPQEDTHEQKMQEMCKHRDAHVAYWKAHGNRQTDPKRFEDGFIQGWCDAENPSYPQITVNSMIQQRHQEHVQRCGDSQCEWAFDDGYREGFESRNRCRKPPQQPASQPPNTTPATQPPSVPVSQPNNPPTNSNPPATHQCTAECNQGKGCQHATATPVPAPTKPGNNEGHCDTKTGDKGGSDSDEDHQCTEQCKGECKHHKKKTGLLHRLEHKIEHALKLD